MYRTLLIVSALLVTQPLYAQTQEKEDSLYMRIKLGVEAENQPETTDLAIQRFATGVYYDNPTMTNDADDNRIVLELPDENSVDYALANRIFDMCADTETNITYGGCDAAQEQLRLLVQRNIWHRKLGIDLTVITGGYEAAITNYPAKLMDLLPAMSSITHMWRAGSDLAVHPIAEQLVDIIALPSGDEGKSIQEKNNELMGQFVGLRRLWISSDDVRKLDDSEMVAALHRYRHGLKQFKGASCEDHQAESILDKRWCNIEDKLKELHQLVLKETKKQVDRSTKEYIIFSPIVTGGGNMITWIRKDDIGIEQVLTVSALQTPLYPPEFGDCLQGGNTQDCYQQFASELLRGGDYPQKIGDGLGRDQPNLGLAAFAQIEHQKVDNRDPHGVVPEPGEDGGICSHPFAKKGYLCRAIEQESCELTDLQKTALSEGASKNGIVLSRCQPERFKGQTSFHTSGPSMCEIGGWKNRIEDNVIVDTPERQTDMQVTPCHTCAIDIVCSDTCGDDGTANGSAQLAKQNGVIEICLKNDLGVKTLPILIHEIIHAQQGCRTGDLEALVKLGLLFDETLKDPAAKCCAGERAAYLGGDCKYLSAMGVLDAIGLSIDQCASAKANASCADNFDDDPDDSDYVCTNDGVDPADVDDAIDEQLKKMANTLKLPTTCEAAIGDPRVESYKNSISLSCGIGCASAFENTIGNNLCYTGQCIEETYEHSRQGTGRMPLTANDESYPWDSCNLPDPNLGTATVMPARTRPLIPTYNPAKLMRMLDEELCQLNGLPLQTPPVLCAFNAVKRLNLPPLQLIQSVADLDIQPREYEAAGLSLQFAAEGIGAMVVSEMYTNYLRASGQHFSDLLNAAQTIMLDIGAVKFPATMCPRGAGGGFSCSTLKHE